MLKKILSVITITGVMVMFSCEMENVSKNEIPQSDLDAIALRGFGTSDVIRMDDGYLVEGDILLTHDFLNSSTDNHKLLRIAEVEQYRTTNLVNGPRVITISVSSQLPSSYVAAADEAIARYNAQNLTLTFQRVSSGANIALVKGNGQFLASAGFPTSSGNPYGQVKVNSRAIGNQPQSTVATILAHEIGHCIGFRHTDFMDRSYSCGGSPTNEGASSVGAILIPGTPSGPDSGSWMLSCIGSGQNRPFNNNDRTALSYLY